MNAWLGGWHQQRKEGSSGRPDEDADERAFIKYTAFKLADC